MVNYSNSKIYKIWSLNGDKIYVGETTKQYLSQRMDKHRDDYKQWLKGKDKYVTSFILFEEYGLEHCQIELLEAQYEGKYIRLLDCVNKVIPDRTKIEYLETNREIILQKKKINREENKEEIKEYADKYREENKEVLNEKQRKEYQQNKESHIERAKEYRAKHQEEINERQRVNRIENKEIINAKQRQHRAENKDEANEKSRLNHEKNKEIINARKREKRAEQKANGTLDYDKINEQQQMNRLKREEAKKLTN